MESLTLRPRKAVVEEPMESWDDDDLDIGGDDFTFRSASLATTATHHRDSVSSRLSTRSDFDSSLGDEEKQVHVPGDDQTSTDDAIATAKRAGIPIPQNVPASALMGGTIKRLGGKKVKKITQDDWDDGDLELPGEGGLTIKRQDASNFPDALRQVSAESTHSSPGKPQQPAPKFNSNPRPDLRSKMASSNLMLDRFRDEEDGDFFGDGGDTIKVSKSRSAPKLLPLVTPPTPRRNDAAAGGDDDFEGDFQLPADNEPLRLSTRRDIPKTPASLHDDTDEWGEGGSLGTRHGGTKRDRTSNRSSSTTALSPSVASSLTIESEDEGLDGLVLPSGPLHFDDILKRRQQAYSPDHPTSEKLSAKRVEIKEDFLTGLEIGDGDVFDSKKLTLNRNIKMKTTRQTSPARPKTAVSLTFTNKPTPAPTTNTSRLPRPLGGHERQPSALEPVSESGGPILRSSRRSHSRLRGHSSQSSITSVATPTTPSSGQAFPPSTPRRREPGGKPSITALRKEATTTNAQLLKLKRSMPTMRSFPNSPARPMGPRYERPPSRTDLSRNNTMSRPRTPVERDRSGAESSMSHARKHPAPFLPAGSSSSQSQHVTIKTSRHLRRHDSESSNTSIEFRPSSRAVSRSTMRSPSPRRPRGAEVLAREAAPKRTLTKPVRRRHFGDGCELDGFDDLPTSKDTEQKFVKEPIGRGPPKLSSLRNKILQETPPLRTTTPAPLTPYSPARTRDELPRFARDTNASRMAREHSLAHRVPSAQGAPLATLTNQWKAKVSATTGLSNVNAQSVKPKKMRGPPQKPQLIKPLGNSNNPKSVKGMYYNPYTYRWEGNENELTPFDIPAPSPSAASIPSHIAREKEQQMYREKENATPRPALIQNVNSCQNVQVVGGMVFDPQRMCWLKMPSQKQNSKSEGGDTMDGFDALDDEEDVFKDVPDLEDNPTNEASVAGGRKSDGASTLKDEWLVGEEFDVGPEFVRRQREEEERWRRKCEKWVGASLDRGTDNWRWSIRDVVN
ncbi:cytokinesis regulator [Drepanopeziza brunnea f. sp. 'multigermtubi' MB_m1]|uniref:Cytokinesis regulator n=2 Tax=Drepanopeziza brunnea f. sp. 'multigermtubi' TaxID=698441 RepID=K1WFR6_MARBU|nr:cytokinesis regulator [Drepanopeziza brunnea f. sp. 'multigermtubi' MB_m1]EKD16325.1 cytokinesis regulator [Drepanopeziza brunnea f. sp. 'multigermtubi' MB_m1]